MPIGIFPKSFSTKRVNVASGPPNNRVSPDLPLTENDELGKTGKIQDDAGNETSQNDPMTNNDLRAVSPMPEPLKNPYNPFKRSPTSLARSRDKDMNNTAKDRGMPTEKLALNVSLNPFKRNSSLNTRETNVDSNVKRDNETSAPAKNDKTTASSVNPVNEKESVTPGTKKPMTNNPPLSQLNTVSQPLSVKSSIIQVTSAAGNGKPQSYADKNNPKSLAVNGTSPRKSIDNTPPAELDDIQVQTRLHGRRATIVDNEALLKSEQLTFRRALENFVGNTSISGLPQILTSRYKFTRTLWTIALLACLAVFLVNAIVLITRYYEFPVETKVTVTFSISSEFPSVTLCNLNPVRLSQIRKNARFSTALQKTMPELAAEVQKSVEKVKQTLGEELYQQLENKAQKYNEEERTTLTLTSAFETTKTTTGETASHSEVTTAAHLSTTADYTSAHFSSFSSTGRATEIMTSESPAPPASTEETTEEAHTTSNSEAEITTTTGGNEPTTESSTSTATEAATSAQAIKLSTFTRTTTTQSPLPTTTPPPTKFNGRYGDCPGNDIITLQSLGISLTECAIICASNHACLSFVFSKATPSAPSGDCFPKNSTCETVTSVEGKVVLTYNKVIPTTPPQTTITRTTLGVAQNLTMLDVTYSQDSTTPPWSLVTTTVENQTPLTSNTTAPSVEPTTEAGLPGYTAQPGYCDDIYVLFAAIDNTSSPQECAKICDNIPKLCKGFVMTQNSLCKPIHAVCKGKILYSENNEHTLYIRDRRRRRSIDLTEATQILRDKRDTLTNQTTPSYTDYTLRRKYSQEYAKLPPRDRVALAHQEEDFIVGCSWNGEDCDMSTIYQFQTYRLGNCFTFNHGRQNTTVRKISKSGPDYGLTLTLNIEQYEYVPSITDTAGIRVVIHSKDVMPYPANDGITIAPGFASNVGIKRRVIIRKPDPYGNCTRPEDALYKPKSYGYSVKACLMDCLQRSVKEHCGCRYPSLLSDEEVTRMCDDMPGAHDELCFQRIHKKYIEDTLGCYCPEACEDVSYQMEVSTAKWPAVNNREKWEKRVANKNPELKKLIESGTEFAKAENNFAQLKVFYQELNLEKTAQSPAYPRENLLGDLGGQLGLWVGLSMLTLCECIEFLWIVGVIGFQNCKSFVKQRRERGATGEVKKKANGKTDDY